MIHCRDCRYWLRTEPPEEIGTCESPKFFYGYGTPPEDLAPDEVLVENDEGWGMFTGPEFGCVHGDARSEKNAIAAP